MSQSKSWKFSIFSVIALMLTMGLFAGSALAAATGNITSGGVVVAGSAGNTITIQVSGATVGQQLSITPPSLPAVPADTTPWSPMSTAGAGLTVVTGGDIVTAGTPASPAIVINPTATSLTIVYGSGGGPTGARAGSKVEVTSFAVKDPATNPTATSTIPIVATADGSGDALVNNASILNESAGAGGRTFAFKYTAVGNRGTAESDPNNQGILNNGELTLTIPAAWPAPTSSNISVSGNPNGDEKPDPASVGTFSISGSGPWTISVPLLAMDGGEEVEIQYKNVTVPFTTGNYTFPMRVRGFGGILTPIRIDANRDGLADTASGSLEINVNVAGRGSGTMTVSGGPISAGSTGNVLTFIYTAEGTLDGGGLELVPPTGWTEPQGSPGSAGYTTVEFLGSATGTLAGFSEDKGDNRPDFTGKGVNILFTRMRIGEQVKIVYGAGGGNSGATAPSTTGLSFFDVFAAPSFPIGNADGDNTAKFSDSKKPFVSIQAADGSGQVQIQIKDKSETSFRTTRTTNAGELTTLKFIFTAVAPMNSGLFSVTVPNSWPIPTSDNTAVTSTGSVDAAIFLQREIRVPIVFLSSTQTITIEYGKVSGDKQVTAPGIPESSTFVFKSQGTPSGAPAVIPEPTPDADPPSFVVKVGQAKDGSGTATIPDSQKKVTASSTGKTFTITYTAIGRMSGGVISVTNPANWTPIKDHVSIVVSSGASLANQAFPTDNTVRYDIVTLERNQTITFTYSNVTVQSTTGTVTLQVQATGSGTDDPNISNNVSSPTVTVDNVADGTGTATISPSSVPATDNKDFIIKYKAIGEMKDDPATTASEGGTVRITIPASFVAPQTTTQPSVDRIQGKGYTTVTGGGSAALSIFGRVITVQNVTLAQDAEVTINYQNVDTPTDLSTHTFLVESQGRPAVDSDRTLVAIASSPTVTVGNVRAGNAKAEIPLPAPNDAGERKLVAGATGATVKIVFTAVGPMDGGLVKIQTPATWTRPGGTTGANFSGQKGFVTVVPSSGALIGGISFSTTDTSFTIPIVTLRKDQTLTITFGDGGGASGVDLPLTETTYDFNVSTSPDSNINNLALFVPAPADVKKLQIIATPLDGSGTIAVSPAVVAQSKSGPISSSFTFQYTAAGNIGSLKVVQPAGAGWTSFKHPTHSNSAGRISVSGSGLPTTANFDWVFAGGGNTSTSEGDSVELRSLSLTAGQTISITYNNAQIPAAGSAVSPLAGDHTFQVFSFSSTNAFPSGTVSGLVGSGSAVIAIVSPNGSGKVSSSSTDVNQSVPTIGTVRAGSKNTLNFFLNLPSNNFIKKGELEIVVPSPWTTPATSGNGKVEARLIVSGSSPEQEVDLDGDGAVEDDRPPVTISGPSIIVSIAKLVPGNSIKVIYTDGIAPTTRQAGLDAQGKSLASKFLVRSKTLETGIRLLMPLNQVVSTEDSRGEVQVTDGANGSGSATSTIPATVPSGSSNNTFVFTYTAAAELSTRDANGNLVTGSLPTNYAAIQLTIPANWSMPNIAGGDQAAGSANVEVSTTGRIDFNGNGDLRDQLVFTGTQTSTKTIEVPIQQLLPSQTITLTYGAGNNKVEAQGTVQDPVIFKIASRGGEAGDAFTFFPDGATPSLGEFKFKTVNAPDGSGTVARQVTINGADSRTDRVFAADTGIEVKFTFTAGGKMDGGAIRLVPPTGWSPPSGNVGTKGYTTSTAVGAAVAPKLGTPSFDGAGVTFPVVTIDGGQQVDIFYGAGGSSSGAQAPAGATGSDAPKFRVETRGSSSGSLALAAEAAVDVVNARSGTGTGQVSPSTTNAGKKQAYEVIYTALGTMNDAKIRFTIPAGWTLPTFNSDNMPVTTSGGELGAITYDSANRRVEAIINKLAPNQTVKLTLKDTTAQPTKQTGDSVGARAIFPVQIVRDKNVAFVDALDANGENTTDALTGDRRANVGVNQAADGSGTMAIGGFRNIYQISEQSGDLTFTYTVAGTMLEKGQITVDVPDGWTAPQRSDSTADGYFTLEGTAVTAGKIEDPVLSGRTLIAKIQANTTTPPDDNTLIANETIVFRYKNPKAPSMPGAYQFTTKSRAQEGGSLTALSAGSPVITVSPSGDGSGAMTLDQSSVPAAKSGFAVTFTYTAAQSITGGELRVTIPSSWSAALDNIKDVGGTTNKATLRIQGNPNQDNNGQSVSFTGSDRTLIIPLGSMAARNQVIFTYTGTSQSTAGTATFTTVTKITNAGTLTAIATPPSLTVTNVEKGRGTVTVTPLTVPSASSGIELTFKFKAAGTMDGGSVSMEVPLNWSLPQLNSGVAGYTTVSTPSGGLTGTVSVSGRVVTVPITTLGPDQVVQVTYGAGSGSSGAVSQANAGGATFTFKTKGSSGDDFTAIASQPTVTVTNAPDGSGTMTVAPTTVTAGSVVQLTFTYTPSGTINGGKIQLTVPSNWTSPIGTSGLSGFTTAETDAGAALGTLTFSGKSVTVPISALSVGQTVRIKYGSGGGNNGVLVPPDTGRFTFSTKSQGLTDAQGGQLIELFSPPPVVTVNPAGDGSGTATATAAATVTAGSTGNSVTIVYTAAGPMSGGGVSVTMPTGWSAPEGRTTVESTGTIGVITFSGQTVMVAGVNLSANQTITFKYTNATAQGNAGTAFFVVKSKGIEDGTLTTLTNAPNGAPITVNNAADGSGTLVANPSIVVAGLAANINLIYTAVGTITNGVLRITVPDDWTAPQTSNANGAGYIAVETTGTAPTPSVTGREITVPITSLGPGGTVTVSYRNATGPSTVGAVSTFNAQSRGSATGTSTSLAKGASVTTRPAASVLAISSAPQTVFKGAVSGSITIETRDADGNAAPSAGAVTVNLSSSSSTGVFDTSATGAFNGTVTSVTIPVGQTSATVFYKDTTAGTVTLTATATGFPAATRSIAITESASVLALLSAGTVFEGDTLQITVETRDGNGNPAISASAVTVNLSSSSATGTFEPATVNIDAGATSNTATYKDTKAGTATLTASATGFTSGTGDVTVNSGVISVTVSGSPVKGSTPTVAGGTVTVTALGKPGATPATFSIGNIVTDKALVESPAGTYTGEFKPVAEQHPDGTYDVVVKIGSSSLTKTGGVVIDNTAPTLTVTPSATATIKNGQTLVLEIKSESGLTVKADVSALDTTQTEPVVLAESKTEAGVYSASVVISENNTAANGVHLVTINATDVAGNAAKAITVSVDLRNFVEFDLSVPKDISLIHIPLKVTGVGTQTKSLKTVGDLFDALGGSANVNFIITRDTSAGAWRSYLGDQSKGTSADKVFTDDLGLITVMKNAVTLRLKGDALGTNGKSQITLKRGTNLIGVPLKNANLKQVSDLLTLTGIKDNATSIIVSDAGTFKVVTQPTDPGNIALTGGQSFIITARADGVAEVTGEAWDNVSSRASAAPPMALVGLRVDTQTPVLEVHGAVVDEVKGVAKDGFRITVKNLSTGASLNTHSGGDTPEGRYSITFVESSGRAAQVGDILEISVDTQNPLIGVQPLRHIVTTDDVKASQIQLENLISYEIPKETKLLPNYPNPFNPETWVPYRLAKDSFVTLTLYDTMGKLVRTIQVGHKPAAVYESRDKAIYWDGRNDYGERVASGIYFYNLTAKDFTATRKMVILK